MDESGNELYYRLGNGGVSRVARTHGEPEVPEDATPITREEYEQELAVIRAYNAQQEAELRATEEEQRSDDYEALRAAGIPEATARRLTGHAA